MSVSEVILMCDQHEFERESVGREGERKRERVCVTPRVKDLIILANRRKWWSYLSSLVSRQRL